MQLNRSYWAIVLVALLVLPASVRADEEQPRPASPQAPPATQPASRVLHNSMEEMGRAFKKLQAQISDSSRNESSLALLVQIQKETLASKNEVPRLVQRMPTTQQADAKVDYRMMMLTLLRMETELEEQLLNSDNKKAAETVATMDKLQKDGHKDFRPQRNRNAPRREE